MNKTLLTKYQITLLFTLLFISTACEKPKPEYIDSILSCTVAFAYGGDELTNFFTEPAEAYVSGYFMFEDNLADDIIFGLDIEWLEGVDDPINFEGADWMALAGFSRKGILWYPVGSSENLSGTATNTDKWEVKQLGTELAPNIWYKMTIVADFNKKEFVSVKIEDNGIDQEFDLSGSQLEYPNYIPFDKPSLTYYAFALRSLDWAPDNHGGTNVYFDDIEIGLIRDDAQIPVFVNGFENQKQIQDIPLKLPVSPLKDVQENRWYFENDEAKIKIVDFMNRTGQYSLECDANLKKN